MKYLEDPWVRGAILSLAGIVLTIYLLPTHVVSALKFKLVWNLGAHAFWPLVIGGVVGFASFNKWAGVITASVVFACTVYLRVNYEHWEVLNPAPAVTEADAPAVPDWRTPEQIAETNRIMDEILNPKK